MEKGITFIAKRYRKGKFSEDKGWRRLNIKPSFRWTYLKIAASIFSVVVLSATAAVIYHQYEAKVKMEKSVREIVHPTAPLTVVKVMDFEDIPLTTVISSIKEVYGVEVVNVPENAGDYHLSLHFEGNVVELVATINDILELQMSVKE